MDEKMQTFSPRRLAWITAIMSMLLIPLHFFVSVRATPWAPAGRLGHRPTGWDCLGRSFDSAEPEPGRLRIASVRTRR